jgi:hypothetical protein
LRGLVEEGTPKEGTPNLIYVFQRGEKEVMDEKMRKVSEAATELMQNVSEWIGSKTVEMAAAATKCEENAAEIEKLTRTQTEMESRRCTLQDKLEQQVSETKEVQDNNEALQRTNKTLKGKDQATKDNTRESQEANKQLKQMLDRTKTELKENKETIDKQCRDIGEVKRANSTAEAEAAEKIAQLETMVRQKDREVEEARYQPPPRNEWLLQGGRLSHTIRKIYTDRVGLQSRPTVCVCTSKSGAMERFQAETEQELNRGLREMAREDMNSTQICSNEEAAQIVNETVEWVVNQRDAMEKITAVWDCEKGDVVTIKVDTGDDDRPVRLVQGTVTGIPSKRLTSFRQKTVHEVITIDDNEYQVSALLSIQQTPRNGEREEANSPGSARNTRESTPSKPRKQKKQRGKEGSREFDSPSFRNETHGYGSCSDSDSSEVELIQPIDMSPPAVPMPQTRSMPNSPNKSTWSSGSTTMATATNKEVEKHSALVTKAQHLKTSIEKADMRTEDGRRAFREAWRQVASPAYMYGPAIPLWSLASLLKAIAPLQHKMNSVVDKTVKEDDKNPGMYEFRAHVDTEDSEKGSFKKRLCNMIYKEMTGTPWEDTVKVEKRGLWRKVRLTGDISLLKEYMEQVTEDLMEQAAFIDRKRFEQAVTATVGKIGWETHSSVIMNAAALRAIFAEGGTSREIADKFREGILLMYKSVLCLHESAISFCVDDPEICSSPAYEETVGWLTVDYIGKSLYDLISLKSKKQWGLEEQRYGRGGQSRSATKSRYTAQQVDHGYTNQQVGDDGDYELAEVLRSEGVSSDQKWEEMCETFRAEMDAAETGHNTLFDERGIAWTARGATILNTIMNVENKIAPEKRTFFRSQDERPERIQGASYGYRGQPKPDPESTESVEYCKQINWSQMNEEDTTEMLCAPCEEHPPQPGQELNHLNFQCCSCFHRMRDCNRMLIRADEKIKDWKDLADANSDTRKKARFDMQRRADAAMRAQTWVPEQVVREIEQREAVRDAKRFKKR